MEVEIENEGEEREKVRKGESQDWGGRKVRGWNIYNEV